MWGLPRLCAFDGKDSRIKPDGVYLDSLHRGELFLSIPAIDIEIPNLVFAGIVFGTILITLGIHYIRKQRA